MAVTSPRGKRRPAASSVVPGALPSQAAALPPRGLPARFGRHVPRVAVHNLWVVVLLFVMVGKVGEWAPVISGLPVVKITFLIAAFYVARSSGAYERVRVSSLPLVRLAIAFFVLSIVSIAWSILKSGTLFGSYLAVIYLISFVMVVKTTHTLKDVERLLIGLALAGISLSIAEFLDFHGGRAALAGYDPNDLAYSLDALLPIVLVLRGRTSRLSRVLVSLLALMMCMAVLLTASRGGAVGLLAVLLAAAIFPLDLGKSGELKRRNIWAVLTALGLVAALGTLMFGYLPEESQQHLLTLIHPEEDYNTSTTDNASRRVIWNRDLRLALERPIGYGLGTSATVDGLYGHGQYRVAHNSVLQVFLELGVLGLVLYLASYFIAWRELGRISSARQRDGPDGNMQTALYARALRIALLGNFTAGFFLSQAYSACLWMILAICCAFIRITTAERSPEPSPSPSARSASRRPRTSA